MALLRYNYRSQALGHYVDITVAWPTSKLSYYGEDSQQAKAENPVGRPSGRELYRPDMTFQTLYLIHGGGEDDTVPYRMTNIEETADKNKLMVITAAVPNTFGVDALYGVNYFTFLTEELPVVAESLFHASPRREDRFVAGYAMGANVALGMAVIRPDLFAACVDISGGIGMTLSTQIMVDELGGDHFPKFFPRYIASFGTPETFPGSKHDLYPIAKRHKEEGVELPKFYIACGSKEFIRFRVEEDVRILKELEYPVEYIVAEGYDHDFEMWRTYLDIAVNEWLPLKRRIL